MSGQLTNKPRLRSAARLAALVLIGLAGTAAMTPASAGKIIIGTEEELRHIQDVELKTRDGEALYLGYKLSFHWLGLPYAMTDGGYVLGVKGQNRYYALDANAMKEWQAQGYLPAAMPKYQIRIADYLLAYLMWIVLGLAAAWYGGRALIGGLARKSPSPAPAMNSRPAASVIKPRPAQAPASSERPAEARIGPRQAPAQPQLQPISLRPAEIANLPVAKTVARVKALKN